MSLSIYSKASVDALLALKANLTGATFSGTITAPNITITSGSGGVLTFSDGTTMSTASGGGGGATWGSITGSISSQTDLQTEFGNYLLLSGGTMTGALTLGSNLDAAGYEINNCNFNSPAGSVTAQNVTMTSGGVLTFGDSTVQTTAATTFTGGSITTAITAGNLTTDSYFGADLIYIELTGTSQNSVLTYEGLSVTDGTNTASFNLSGIHFPDGTTQTTAYTGGGGGGAVWGSITGTITSQTDLQSEFANYLPLSGGTMTGALYSTYGSQTATFFGSTISISDGTYSTAIQPSYLYTSNGSVSTYVTPAYIQFADGSTQTTAASGGMDYNAAVYAGTCAYLGGSFVSFDGTSTFTFNIGSGVPAGGDYFVHQNNSIGITQDTSTFYQFDTIVSAGVFQASTFTGNFDSGAYIYLAFKDSAGTWHWCPNCILYTN